MAFVTIVEISMLIPQVGKFIQCNQNLQCILISLPTTLVYSVIMIKLLTCQFNSKKIKHLTDQLYIDWKHLKSPEEREIMKMYAARARLISLIYSSYYFICCPMFIFISLTPKILDIVMPLNESRPILMPHEAHYFVNDDREYFYYIFFHASISMIIIVMALLAHDCVILTYIEHVCGIFAVAGFRFENLAHNIDIENENIDNIYTQRIALSVHTHWRALQFAEFLENTFSVTLITQMFIIIVAMSVTLLQMVMQVGNSIEMVRYAASVIGQLIHIFCFSLQGQKLIDHSLQMQDKIYNCSWYKIPVKSQKLILNVMGRSVQPNILSAGRIYIFSLKSFMTVLQSAVSYFTVLASFQ
ncbi:putative odorant receptor 85d [Camponotus floridanus]|uniref:putative odorant receptor 85d n=1 Tax=Camponotus floridanus TaxID=104421 RepID=UPI000DC6CCA4|nr:putative odorant receptor 85d [Camponotus floridanus]